MMKIHILSAVLLISGCGTDMNKQNSNDGVGVARLDGPLVPISYPIVPDNVRHDTLLVQVTFDLQDGTFLMVASNVEEKFEGVRLYHYNALPDSSAEILSISTPGYDSWTMLPTLFGPGKGLQGTWLFANLGEKQSWGQKLFWCSNDFQERGFIDVAFPERMTEQDSSYIKRTNIAPYMRIGSAADTTIIQFVCDSVLVYDDLAGNSDIIVPASAIRYTYHTKTGLVLWINGQARRAAELPA